MSELYLLVPILVLLLVGWYFFRNTNIINLFSGSISVLEKYSRDLTKAAITKKLDPVIGREKEISRVIQVLSRRTKNNPVLIGQAGIGKTAIVEGLAISIAKRKVPNALYNKKVFALDLTGILAGTKYRGEFEQRLRKITEEIAGSNRTIILFIDEIHILAEAGEAEGAINAADILKPLLARGELQVVGATTKEEYEKYIKNDKTLDRRLQPIFIKELNEKETKDVLRGIKNVYEEHHNVEILAGAIDQAIKSTKLMKNRAYPDKAIDAIDEACSKVHLTTVETKGKTKKMTVTAQDIKQVIVEWKNNI